MKNKPFPSSWNDSVVAHYDQTIPLNIAGYHLLYDMTSRLLKAGLSRGCLGCDDSPAELLIVGAGGGQELVTLGQFQKLWHFTAIDSSEPMLEIVRRRIEEIKIGNRVRLVKGLISSLSRLEIRQKRQAVI